MIMNEKLQQAISAARNGQETEAQLLLTQVLKENPDETQAWFLLSTLVDSESKKIAYLGKVLTLEPDHQMAKKMLARLQVGGEAEAETETETETEVVVDGIDVEEDETPSAPVVVSYNTADFMAQQKGDTLPEWLIEEEGLEITEEAEAAQPESIQEAIPDEAAEIPDWLQNEVPESWSEEAPVAETALAVDDMPDAKPEKSPAPKPKSKSVVSADKAKQQSFLTGILYALIVITAIIVVIMIYLAWSTFF
jgi:hypothetical protein